MLDIKVGDYVRPDATSFVTTAAVDQLLQGIYGVKLATGVLRVYRVAYVEPGNRWFVASIHGVDPMAFRTTGMTLIWRPKYRDGDAVMLNGNRYIVGEAGYPDKTYVLEAPDGSIGAVAKEEDVNKSGTNSIGHIDMTWRAWAGDPEPIDRHATGEAVRTLQSILTWMQIDCGGVDGVYGGNTASGVDTFERARVLVRDGIVDLDTKAAMLKAAESGWKLGKTFSYLGAEIFGGVHPVYGGMPDYKGRCSWFGGPDDAGDRIYGQALIPTDPEKSVQALYSQHPDLVQMGLFREGLVDPLPQVTDWNGNTAQAGISWCLNPDSYYLAMRWGGGSHRPNPASARVLLLYHDKAVIVAPTDWGPAVSTGKAFDLSPGAMKALGTKTGITIAGMWAADSAPLGPVELKV